MAKNKRFSVLIYLLFIFSLSATLVLVLMRLSIALLSYLIDGNPDITSLELFRIAGAGFFTGLFAGFCLWLMFLAQKRI